MVEFLRLLIFFTFVTSIFKICFANVIVYKIHQNHHKTVIYPGTKWCGSGNIAESYEDLGEDRETDMCCRDHDSCPEYIEAGSTKYGLTNSASYTRLHCPCDIAFHKCLRGNVKETNSSSSAMVGYIYFNQLKTKCYKMERPIMGCKTYTRDTDHCEEYSFDDNSPEIWQWFDVPLFSS